MFGTSRKDQARIDALETELARAKQSMADAESYGATLEAKIKTLDEATKVSAEEVA